MARARQETCPHPLKRRERISYGRYRCARCDLELTPAERAFTVKHSDRVTLTHGDLIRVSSACHCGPFIGVFLYSEPTKSGPAYFVAELDHYYVGKVRYTGWRATFTVRPEYVKQAPGVRDRKRREEVQ